MLVKSLVVGVGVAFAHAVIIALDCVFYVFVFGVPAFAQDFGAFCEIINGVEDIINLAFVEIYGV